MRRSFLLATVLSGSGSAPPVNTVAPAINPVAIVGTQITGADGTWTNASSFTYQWQRNVASVWSNIGGATSKNYTPVDADFAYALRLVVTANGSVSANSNATNLTYINAFTQSAGSELVVNGANPIGFTADNPNSWTVTGESGTNPEATERGSNQGHAGTGTGCINLYNTATAAAPNLRQVVSGINTGDIIILESTLSNFVVGRVDVDALAGAGFKNQHSAANNQKSIGIVTSTTLRAYAVSANTDGTLSLLSMKKVTPNTQQSIPANSVLDFFFSNPASPIINNTVLLMFRIQDSSNFWFIQYSRNTSSNYNIILNKMVAGVVSFQSQTLNIGTTANGIRADFNSNSVKMWSTVDGGSNWTQRGSTATDSAFSTATGALVAYNAEYTTSSLVCTPY